MDTLPILRQSYLCLLLLLLITEIGANIDRAHAQPARQSEITYEGRFAGYAVDGDPTTCSITDTTGLSVIYAWWQVDLQEQYTINFITVLVSPDPYNAQYLTGIDVEVSNTNKTDSFLPTEICISYSSSNVSSGALLNLTCIQPVVGRYVTIKRNGGFAINALTLCEVEVVSLYADPTMAPTLPTTATTTATWNPTSVNNSTIYSTTQCSCSSCPSTATVNSTQSAAIIVGVVLGVILIVALIIIIILILKMRNMKVNFAVVARRNDITTTDERQPNYATLDPTTRSEETTAPYEKLRIKQMNKRQLVVFVISW